MGHQPTMASYTECSQLNLIIVALLFSLTFVYETSAVTGSPSHQVVISGSSTAILSCSTDLDASVAFYFKPWTSTEDPDEIFDRNDLLNGYKSKFKVIRNGTKHYNLETLNAEKWHAGQYSCYKNDGIGGLLSTVDLTILDSKLSCNYSRIDTNSVLLRCEITYFGASVDLASRWSSKDSPSDGSLLKTQLTKTESKLIAEIKVDTRASSGSGASSTLDIFLGFECQNSQQFCSILNQSIVVPLVPTSTVSDLVNNVVSATSTNINTNTDAVHVALAVSISLIVVIIVVVVIVWISYKTNCFKNKSYKKIPWHRQSKDSEIINLNNNQSGVSMSSETNDQSV